ncbi:MAG: ATP-binding protein [Candidatus Nitrosopolaris sp.]
MHFQIFKKECDFNKIGGYDDIKEIVRRALDSEDNYNLLFTGPPASAKTLFLLGITERERKGVYFDGSNMTNRILDILKEHRPKIICIDEIDKMPRQFQEKLLNFMESGRVKVDQMRKSYDFEIKGAKIFATSNDITRLSKPLQSRFRRLHLPPYTEEQFMDVSVKVLPRLKDTTARIIGSAVWDQKSKDIRDVISIGKLLRKNDGPIEIEQIIKTMIKYYA